MLSSRLGLLAPVPVPEKTMTLLRELIADARAQSAEIVLDGSEDSGIDGDAAVTLIAHATPALLSMQTDIFAPVLSMMQCADMEEALAANAACAYALTAAVFGPEPQSRLLASRLRVGNVSIDDVVIPTADPRIPFGGRGRSGFGVTRGAEGLLAMTIPRVVQMQRSRAKRPYEPTSDGHIELFASLAQLLHAGGIRARWSGLKGLLQASRRLK
jgi:acyl-CoA reductase-like NAD-dependent aldehyde dehydrogenase